jgi:hypothetical protein
MNDSSAYSGKVSAFDGVTHARQWTSEIYDGEFVGSLAAGDPDGNGTTNIIVGSGRVHTGAAGTFVRVYEGSTGELLWKSPSLENGWGGVTAVRVANIDGAGNQEILAASSSWGVMCFDGVTHQLKWLEAASDVSAMEVADVDGDGRPEYLIGTSAGVVTAYDGTTRSQVKQMTFDGSVNVIRVADLDGDGRRELVVSYNNAQYHSYIEVRRISDDLLLWKSGGLAGRAGAGESLLIGDVDDDGIVELAVGTAYSVRVFEVPPANADATPPLFEGSQAGLSTAVSLPTCCSAVDLSWPRATDVASPPVSYVLYRSTEPAFLPSPATRLGETTMLSYRDGTVANGDNYYYMVRAVDRAGNQDGNVRQLSVAVTSIAASPLPALLTLCPGSTLNLSVSATGSGTLSYLWMKNGEPLAGGTGATLSIASVSADDSGEYSCQIFDDCGSIVHGSVDVVVESKHGDVTLDCLVTADDIKRISDFLYGGGEALDGWGDVNGDVTVNAADLFYLINYIYAGGPPPL